MDDLVIAVKTSEQIEAFAIRPAHAVRLLGPAGIGKRALAQILAACLLQTQPSKLADAAYFRHIQPPDGKAIGIEEARQITSFLSLKVPGRQSVDRVVLIEDAHLLTTEAQNALLKMLEEPPVGTIFILTTADDQALLATIRSRSQLLNIQRPTKKATIDYFQAQGHAAVQIDKAYAMSAGLPGLMQAILNDDQHPLLAAANLARQLLGQSAYQRLTLTDELIKDRRLMEQTIDMLSTMAEIGLRTAASNNAQRWRQVLKQSYLASERLRAKAQPKLVVDDLLLQL